MKIRFGATTPGSARVSRAGDRVLAITDFLRDALLKERLSRRDAATNTRDACATRSCGGKPDFHSFPFFGFWALVGMMSFCPIFNLRGSSI